MLILADWLVTSADEPPRPGWGVRVDDGMVVGIGPGDELVAANPDDEVHDGSGHVLLPGFVDAHVHLYGVLAHGMPVADPPDGFWSFLADLWWPRVEDALDHEMIATAADWVSAEHLAAGTTSLFGILEAPEAIPDGLLIEAEVLERRGMRAILTFEATERAGADNGEAGLRENERLIEATRDGSGLVRGAVSYHTTFTCSPDFVVAAHGLAADHGVVCHAHCNEGVHEPQWCEERYGMRTFEHYDGLGVLGPHFLASQCVQMSEAEIDLIARHGVRVSHMPLANCEVGGGIAPMPEMIDRGVTVGLGSDGFVNDMYAVMRGAFLLHKARTLDPGAMPAATVVAMATEGAARAVGLERVGRLEPGWAADLQLLRADLPTPLTAENLLDQIVMWRSGRDVRDVMVAGRWRVLGGEVLGFDVDAARARLHEQAQRLWTT